MDTTIDLPDDDRAEQGLEVPQNGTPIVHPRTTPEDQARARAASVLEAARNDVLAGALHPSKLRQRLEKPLRAFDPIEKREPSSPASIVRAWAAAGRLEHFAIGLAQIDEATGGGLVRGTRWIIVGAPNAGKTALAAHIVRRIAERGDIVVGILAVDEPPDRFVARLAQQCGFTREECEQRDPSMLEQMAQRLEVLGLRIYDRSWTIEEAAADVARLADERGAPGLLAIDSLQTVRCERERLELEAGRVLPITAATEARVQALRDVTENGSRLMIVATSEMVRAGYRKPRQGDEEIDPMAAGKNSGAIEYAALVQISMRPEAKHDGVIRVEIPKNKEGDGRERTVHRGNELYLELDRASQTLTETEKPQRAKGEESGAEDAARTEQLHKDAAAVAAVLAKSPALNTRDLRARCTISNPRTDAATACLIDAGAVRTVEGEYRAVLHYLDGQHVPEEILRHLKGPARNAVVVARPPAEDSAADLRGTVLEVLRKLPGLSARGVRDEVSARTQARGTVVDKVVAELLDSGAIENRGSGTRRAYHVPDEAGSTVSRCARKGSAS